MSNRDKGAGARLDRLIRFAMRKHAQSDNSLWLVAFPGPFTMRACALGSPDCFSVLDGELSLPIGSQHGMGAIDQVDGPTHILLATTIRGAPSEDAVSFRAFAQRAGAALMASPPAWYDANVVRLGDAVSAWVGSLMFLAPGRKRFLTVQPDGYLLIFHPWAASIATLREWHAEVGVGDMDPKVDDKLETPLAPVAQKPSKHPDDDRFADFPKLQRKLLCALDGKGTVLIRNAFRAVHGRTALNKTARASFLQHVRRTDAALWKKQEQMIFKENNTLELRLLKQPTKARQ